MPFARRAALALATALLAGPAASAGEPLQVVASFSILGDLVARVGGDRVAVTTLVGPDGDAHVYQPTPADARALAAADLVVVNGLGFEGWIDRLVAASGYRGPIVVASRGIEPLPSGDGHGHGHGHGHRGQAAHQPDPHAWQDVRNVIAYVATIAAALEAADPAGADAYRAAAATFTEELAALDAEIRGSLAAIPRERRRLITSHDAFTYFAHAYDVEFLAASGVSTEAEASAADVARLIRQIRKEAVRAIFVENVSDPRLIEQIARETGAKIGGTLYSDALSGPEGPAASYVAMMRHNATAIAGALAGS
jgi:zinc/manganese transport system substrate-binding protein